MSNLRPRTVTSNQLSTSESPPTAVKSSTSTDTNTDLDAPKPPPPQRSTSLSQRAISQTLTGTANLANLLPTGTLLAFQLLIPIFTNNGTCDTVTRSLTILLLFLLSISCFVACFTDSIKDANGQVYYGLATLKGLWLFDYPDLSGAGLPDLRKYKIRFIDVVHAVLTVLVFGTVALRDKNVLGCFYPKPAHETQEILDIVPVGIGLICGLLFVAFPTTRHGIGYPVTSGK